MSEERLETVGGTGGIRLDYVELTKAILNHAGIKEGHWIPQIYFYQEVMPIAIPRPVEGGQPKFGVWLGVPEIGIVQVPEPQMYSVDAATLQ
jgi:hypothetical protein